MVLTGASSTTRVRKLTSTDISNHYTETSLKGILGIACHDVKTDSSGNLLATTPPSTVVANTAPTYPLGSYAAGLDVEPITGTGRLVVQIFTDSDEFWIRWAGTSNAAATVTSATVGNSLGLQVADTTEFRADSSATTTDIVAVVSSVNEQDPNYNVSSKECRVKVRIRPTYQQYTLALLYTS